MKKYILLSIVILILLIILIYTSIKNITFSNENKEIYQIFQDKELIDINGEIILLEPKTVNQNLKKELQELFNSKELNEQEYLEHIATVNANNEGLQKEITNLTNELTDLQKQKETLTTQYNVLTTKYQQKLQTITQNNSNNSYNFPLINQNPKYPTGCESVALTMLLNYYGVNVTPDQVINKLKKGKLPYYEDGTVYGGNPELEFIGNPYSNNSYGVYEKPIAEVANSFKSGIQIKNNYPFSQVLSIVDNGTPVMVWTSIGLSIPFISNSWIYKPTMETIYWKSGEHAMIIVGHNDSTVTVADPIGGKLKTYSSSLFESRYNYFGKKALYYL